MSAHGICPGTFVRCDGLGWGLEYPGGHQAKWGAWLLVFFLVPVTLMMHRFWAVTDPQVAMMQQVMFMKNLTMLGTALLISYFGSGPASLDALLSAHQVQRADGRQAVTA